MLTLNLMLDQTRYSQGSSVNATVVLQNVGPETLVVNSRLAVNFSVAPTELQELAFVVTQPSGQVSKYEVLAQVRAPKATNFVALGPNEQVAKVIALDKIYPMPELGVYTVQAVYHNAVTPSDGRTAWQGEIKSNVVTFELTP